MTFGRQGGYHTITGRLQIQTRASSQTNRVARVFFPYGAQFGRRARRTTGKHATRRQRWRASSSEAHIGVDELALSDTMLRLSYDDTMVLRVNRPSTRHRNRSSAATSSRATQTRQHRCALLTMSSSIFGAEQRISEPLSALAVLTGPDQAE